MAIELRKPGVAPVRLGPRAESRLGLVRSRLSSIALCVASIVSIAVTLQAHDTAPPAVVGITIGLTGGRLLVEAQLPIVALTDANLGRDADGRLLQADADSALRVVALDLALALAVRQTAAVVPVSEVTAVLAPDQQFATLSITYLVPPPTDALSFLLHTFRAGSQTLSTTVSITGHSAPPRLFTAGRDPERVFLAPTTPDVVRRALRVATSTILGGGVVLLFLLCLVVPRREPDVLRRSALAFLAAEYVSAGTAGSGVFLSHDVNLTAAAVAGTIAASILVVTALLNVVNAKSSWLTPLAVAFGVAAGGVTGLSFVDARAFAGTHTVAAVATYLTAVALGHAWMMALLSSAVGYLYRFPLPARFASPALAIYAVHTALHQLTQGGDSLTPSDSGLLANWLLILTLAWATLILVAGLIGARSSGERPWPRRGTSDAWRGVAP